jgi:hypothetical protein
VDLQNVKPMLDGPGLIYGIGQRKELQRRSLNIFLQTARPAARQAMQARIGLKAGDCFVEMAV